MIEIAEALRLILQNTESIPPLRMPATESVGNVLAEEVTSDVDSPPHDKSMVDGYAVVAADLTDGSAELTVLEEVTAGEIPSQTVTRGTTTRIMTGAPIPEGADAVVMIERTQLLDGDPPHVKIEDPGVRADQHIMPLGTSLKRGQTVLRLGKVIRPIEVGLLSEVGRDRVLVHPRPRVAVLATGNELVPAGEIPAAGQIRNSNGPMLISQVAAAGGIAVDLGIGRDEEEALRQCIQQGLEHDVLVLSGGVSAGVLDLVPKVLSEVGVEQVFHKVRLKPGKPIWFGVCRGESRNTLVFGLPGNPVGSLVCFELFVRPALARLAGCDDGGLCSQNAVLTRVHQHRGNRPTFFPAVLRTQSGQTVVEPLDWKGSADLCSLTDANCLAHFPAGDRTFQSGEEIEVFHL